MDLVEWKKKKKKKFKDLLIDVNSLYRLTGENVIV